MRDFVADLAALAGSTETPAVSAEPATEQARDLVAARKRPPVFKMGAVKAYKKLPMDRDF